jgi:hypothetical protein
LATGDGGTLYAFAGTTFCTVNTATGAASNPVRYRGRGLGQAFGRSAYAEAGWRRWVEETSLSRLPWPCLGSALPASP